MSVKGLMTHDILVQFVHRVCVERVFATRGSARDNQNMAEYNMWGGYFQLQTLRKNFETIFFILSSFINETQTQTMSLLYL